MEIGIRIPVTGAAGTPVNITRVAGWAEQLGFHSVWVSDHVVLPHEVDSFYPYAGDHRWPYPASTAWLDPLLALSWAAQVAPSVKLGTSVLVGPLRNPMLLAKQLATLDFLTGGRVILGLGAGWMKEEFDLVGVPFGGRGARTEEMVELMRAFWTGDTVDFHGQFWQVSACQMQPAPARGTIPVLWGGHSEHALRRVARIGDGWHPTQLTLEELATGLARLHELCAEHGRPFQSLIINARPGRVLPVDAKILAAHRDLGVTQFVVDPPLDPPNFTQCLEELTRIADLCNLSPRPSGSVVAASAPPGS